MKTRPRKLGPHLTTGQCARLAGVSQQSVIRSIDTGRLKAFAIPGSKHRRVPRADFVAWLTANNIPVPAELGTALTEGVPVPE